MKQRNGAVDEFKRYLRSVLPAYRVPDDARTWRGVMPRLRRAMRRDVFLRGFPRGIERGGPRVVYGETIRAERYRIRKLRYEIYPDYWVPALLYLPVRIRGKIPAVLNPNGHHQGGKAADYKQARCVNLALRGMAALSYEFIGMHELAADRDHWTVARLDMTGMASVGFFYLAMKRGLDVLLGLEHVDPRRCAMTGLSGGGWQTVVLGALDTRITHVAPVAGYMSLRARLARLEDVGDREQTPPDLGLYGDYGALTALLAPRPTLHITNEHDDCCFATARVKHDIYTRFRPLWKRLGAPGALQHYSNVNPGTHNYDADNRSRLYRFLNEQFGLSTPMHDLHQPGDIRCEKQLRVGLPATQVTIDEVARQRANALAHEHRHAPRTRAQQQQLRERLRRVIRLPGLGPATGPMPRPGDRAGRTTWKVGRLSVPITHTRIRDAASTTLVLVDRRDATIRHLRLDSQTDTYVADVLPVLHQDADPLRQYPMLVEASGRRLLGLCVAHALSVTRRLRTRARAGRLRLVSHGPTSGVTALIAAALRPSWYRRLEQHAMIPSLRSVFDLHLTWADAAPLHCADLLAELDLPQLMGLLGAIVYEQPGSAMPPCTCRG